ncbi:MAG TPA: nucleotidyl transferase AbiEii/AbiGii toxin family protein [Caldisericia bacterium]|nr:nucleotidyl transferase AbiEii/AbiGii toxin family protein [Caldisericia bacterium]
MFSKKKFKIFLNLKEYFYGIEKFLLNRIIFLDNVKINFQRESNEFKKYKLNFNIEKIGQIIINLKFLNIPSYLNKTEVLSFEIFDFPIKVEMKKEILIDKVVAFGLRNYIKGRDIWDINFIKNDIKEFSYNILLKKIRDYRKEVDDFIKGTYKNLEIVDKKGIEILESEMKRFLPSKIFNYVKSDFDSIIKDFYKFIADVFEEIK